MQIMNRPLKRRAFGRVFLAAVALLVTFGIGTAHADKPTKSKLSKEARLLSFDTDAGTMTVKEKGKTIVYKVKFEGSVMTRTTATVNAQPVKLADIPLKAKVNIYWRPDENEPKQRFARKVDALNIPEELLDED